MATETTSISGAANRTRLSDLDGADLRGLDLRGADLRQGDLTGRDFTGIDLSGADLTGADLTNARLTGANMHSCILRAAKLAGAQLISVDLTDADLTQCDAAGAVFGQANLENAVFFGADLSQASLSGANACHADFRTAEFHGTRLLETDLTGCDLSRAKLVGADLTGATVDRAVFASAELSEACLRGLKGFDHADWVDVAVVGIDFSGAYLVRRAIMDQNYLHEFRSRDRRHEILYQVWRLTSDCGRSFARWGLLTAIMALAFAAAYTQVDVDYGADQTALSPLYFSVVTLTTLGYGDVLPASAVAQSLVVLEVVAGYVMLGGVLSIFATRMGRRAD